MACEATNSEVPSVSSMTVQATSHRHLNPNSALSIAIMVTAHDDDVSMATEPKIDHTTKTNNCDIITITGNSPMTTKDQQPQEVNRSVFILEWLGFRGLGVEEGVWEQCIATYM